MHRKMGSRGKYGRIPAPHGVSSLRNRVEETAPILGWQVVKSHVLPLILLDGGSGESCSGCMARHASSHARPQVGFSQHFATRRRLDLLWFQVARNILRMDSPMLWLVLNSVHYHSLSDAVVQHIQFRGVPILTWLDEL